MSIYNLIVVIGGLAFFLFGMDVLSSALKKVAGNRLETTLQKMTDYPIKGLIFGAIITIAMQSSSALTVMLVGLVNSGIMSLTQTVGVIMGSNIGTTLTAWILSLSGIQTDNFLLAMLKPENFSPILALIGVCMIMVAKDQKKKDLGTVMVGFAVLMHGMEMMSDALSPLAEVPQFVNVLTAFRNPFFGVIIGMLFTAIIQSSAASVGVLQALSITGQITYGVALPIIMGQNIGTCVTALLSTIGVNKNAKRVSVIHISFNLFGTVIGLIVYFILNYIFQIKILDDAISPFAIAGFHSIFNVATTLLLLPFSKQLVFIAERVIKDGEKEEIFLDKRLMMSPAVAAAECRRKTADILRISTDGFTGAISLLEQYTDKKIDEVKNMEQKVDDMMEACYTFLIQLSSIELSDTEGEIIADLLHGIGDMERISDYSLNVMAIIKKINRENFKHKETLQELLYPINQEMIEMFNQINEVYEKKNLNGAKEVMIKTEELVTAIKKLKKDDLKMLRKGKVEAEASVYLSDYLSVARRVTEHCQNIAESIH